ncbi:MAG: hypothetical protein IJ512_08130 [Ruminococcus sp.]|nr:hypothetical protein [Ruminococcus sp.]
MSSKNRILVSILILMGAALLGSCTSAADANAASATASMNQTCIESVMM